MTQGTIAYFSMEIALENRIPTYSGGLGVLAGDTLRAAADLGLPMVGVTLLHRQGSSRSASRPTAPSARSRSPGRSLTDSSPPRESVRSRSKGVT
jgi:starch phosphorylase